jgi:uncharacterized membrane protein YtjA (UPF0391 family)
MLNRALTWFLLALGAGVLGFGGFFADALPWLLLVCKLLTFVFMAIGLTVLIRRYGRRAGRRVFHD